MKNQARGKMVIRSHSTESSNRKWEFIESSLMIEAHGFFASKSEMNSEFDKVLDVCSKWSEILCFDYLLASRPVFLNKPVSTTTIGFDIVVPWGQTLQTSVAYVQDTIYSNAFNINNSVPPFNKVYQITFGISERNAMTCLLQHMDELGLRLPLTLSPVQLSIIVNDGDQLGLDQALRLENHYNSQGIRVSIKVFNGKDNLFQKEISQGTPVHVWFTKNMTEHETAYVFRRHNGELTTCKFKDIVKSVDDYLLESDKILKTVQVKIKEQSMTLFQDSKTSKKKDVKVAFIHNDRSCIEKASALGYGELIGFDYSSRNENSNRKCEVCNRSDHSARKCYISHRI